MSESILIGTRGWDYENWTKTFYPEQLPNDWRFCYYSNELRSLLVLAETWETVERRDIEQWVEDSDPEFRFILELPKNVLVSTSLSRFEKKLEEFIYLVEPIRRQVSGLLMTNVVDTKPDLGLLETKLTILNNYKPVCVDTDPGQIKNDIDALLVQSNTGVCWHTDREPSPRPGGRLLVAITQKTDPKEQRCILDTMAKWQEGQAIAGLFFDNSKHAAKQAQQARILAELMGV